eukprot:CAMPEP_0206570044 /NCGR_PEP_ID=MMETSP0325_2-20121206/26794_1 /ASSEMBLY_ACC=CAM_ASM_000347 /TAXON_ID=2866 /ORGANISM="Crypthecodinium cohnii, Strain Seligo" /LENGTH=38 /DNA_ID= /DNA_START= /DNA_END= /DNA_ORIENTATION=
MPLEPDDDDDDDELGEAGLPRPRVHGSDNKAEKSSESK